MTDVSRSRTGSCYCGTVRFAVEDPPRFVAHCHCANCRRAHGAAFVTWAGYPAERFRFIGGEERAGSFLSETGATRRFCLRCGTPFLFSSPRWAGEAHVAVAALLDADGLVPKAHAYADRAPAWCPITDTLPRFGGPSGNDPLQPGLEDREERSAT